MAATAVLWTGFAMAQQTQSRGPLKIIPGSRTGAARTPSRDPVQVVTHPIAQDRTQTFSTTAAESTQPSTQGQTQIQTRTPGRIAAIAPGRTGGVLSAFEKIEVGTLGKLDGASASLLADPASGVGSDLWRGSVAPVIVDYLERVEPHPMLRSVNALATRLLLSGGEPPAGAGDDFAVARVHALQRFGQAEAAARLASAVAGQNDDLRRLSAEAALSSGNADAACSSAFDDQQSADAFWGKLRAFCEAKSGNESAALLEADLLRDSGDSDEAFYALLDRALFGIDVQMPKISDVGPIHFAMMTQGGDLPNVRRDTVPAGYLKALQSRASDPVDRAVMAVRGWTLGVIDTDALAKTLVDVPEASRGPLARTYVQFAAAEGLQLKVDGLEALWAYGAPRKRLSLVSALGADETTTVIPEQAFDRARPGFVQALLMIGDIDGAIAWFEMPPAASLPDREVEAALAGLIALSDPEGPITLSPADREVLRNAGPRGEVLLTLVDSTSAQWPPASSDRRAADLVEAVDNRRKGEALLAALNLLGERDDIRSATLSMRALRQIGFADVARAISMDLVLQTPWLPGR